MMQVYLLAAALNRFLADAGAAINSCPGETTSPDVCTTGLPKVAANNGSLQAALYIVFGTVGAVAVLIIVIEALRLVIASGDPEANARIRKTIIYAAVGLIISLFADAIVGFVLGRLGS